MSNVKKIYTYLLQMIVGSILPLVTIPIITNVLSPAEFGVFALIQVYALILVNVACFGLHVGYERNYFDYGADSDRTSSLFYSSVLFTMLTMLILYVVVFFINSWLSELLFNSTQYSKLILYILAGESFLSLSQFYNIYLRNTGLATSFAKIAIFRSALYFVLIVLFMQYLNLGLMGMGYAILISSIMVFVIVTYLAAKSIRFSLNIDVLMSTLRISLPLTPRTLLGFLNTHFDKMMLGLLASIGGVGVYSIGQKVSQVIFQFMTALEYVFIPGSYKKFFSDDKDERDSIGMYLTPFMYFSVFCGLLVILFSEELFMILMPPSYYAAVDVVVILSIFYTSLFFGKIIGTQLIYAKKTHVISILTILGVVINVALNIPMITYWGIAGAAYATLIAGVINGVIGYKVAERYAPIAWEWRKIIPMFVVFVSAAVWILFSRKIMQSSYEYRLLGKIILLVGFLWVGFYMSLLSRKRIMQLIRQAVPSGK